MRNISLIKEATLSRLLTDRAIRVPFNYRHFENNMDPSAPYDERGFLWLDRIINIVSRLNLYILLLTHPTTASAPLMESTRYWTSTQPPGGR